MHKCDFCKYDPTCSGVNRSECIVRDYFGFEAEQDPDDDVKSIARLITECHACSNPMAIAQYLVRCGVVLRRSLNI